MSASGIRNSTGSKVSVLSTLNKVKSTKYRVLSKKKKSLRLRRRKEITMETMQTQLHKIAHLLSFDYDAYKAVPNISIGMKREAWRYELSNNERLRLYGVDFNESPMPNMKTVKASMVQEVPAWGMTLVEYEQWHAQSELDEQAAEPAYLQEVA